MAGVGLALLTWSFGVDVASLACRRQGKAAAGAILEPAAKNDLD